jgi:hypothetical protein
LTLIKVTDVVAILPVLRKALLLSIAVGAAFLVNSGVWPSSQMQASSLSFKATTLLHRLKMASLTLGFQMRNLTEAKLACLLKPMRLVHRSSGEAPLIYLGFST